MIEHFTHNELLSKRLAETDETPAVRRQLTQIIRYGNKLGLDWYFTGRPERTHDLRCGRREINKSEALKVCFRIWIKKKNQIRIEVDGLHIKQTPLDISKEIVSKIYAFMKGFAEANPADRPVGGFLPDQYIQADLTEQFDSEVVKSLRSNRSDRLKRLKNAQKQPKPHLKETIDFDRNPDVVAETLFQADGKCQRCKKRAPFIRRKDGTPYLEVHHKVPLIENGPDTVENAIALCPNCHREMHFGNPSVVL